MTENQVVEKVQILIDQWKEILSIFQIFPKNSMLHQHAASLWADLVYITFLLVLEYYNYAGKENHSDLIDYFAEAVYDVAETGEGIINGHKVKTAQDIFDKFFIACAQGIDKSPIKDEN